MGVAAPWVAVTRTMVHLVATQALMMVEWRGICSLKVLEVVFLLMAHLAIAQLDMDMVLPLMVLVMVVIAAILELELVMGDLQVQLMGILMFQMLAM